MLDRALADIDRLVADAFEVRDEPKSGCQKAQVVGDGLPQRENAQDESVGLELVAIDLSVECLHVSHDLGSPSAERLEGQPDDSFASSAHREEVRLKLAKLGLVVPAAVRCGRFGHRFSLPQSGGPGDLAAQNGWAKPSRSESRHCSFASGGAASDTASLGPASPSEPPSLEAPASAPVSVPSASFVAAASLSAASPDAPSLE